MVKFGGGEPNMSGHIANLAFERVGAAS